MIGCVKRVLAFMRRYEKGSAEERAIEAGSNVVAFPRSRLDTVWVGFGGDFVAGGMADPALCYATKDHRLPSDACELFVGRTTIRKVNT